MGRENQRSKNGKERNGGREWDHAGGLSKAQLPSQLVTHERINDRSNQNLNDELKPEMARYVVYLFSI